MSEPFLTPNRLAADDYWGDIQSLPDIPSETNFFSGRQLKIHGARIALGLYEDALEYGFISADIPDGTRFPKIDRGKQILRILEDRRQYPYVQSLRNTLLGKDEVNDAEAFIALAETMSKETLYKGPFAQAVVPYGTEGEAGVWRGVSYLGISHSGKVYEGISCDRLDMIGSLRTSYELPRLQVGQSYERKRAHLISKVISASVITPKNHPTTVLQSASRSGKLSRRDR